MSTDEELLLEANLLQQDGQLNEASVLYKQLIANNPIHPQAIHRLALTYAQLGDMPNAILFFQQALTVDPKNPSLYNNLANAYKHTHQIDLATEYYQKAIELAPDYAQAHNNLAGIHAINGRYQYALQGYKNALHAEPDFAAAHYNLGLLFMNNQQLTAAKTQFNNVITLNPDHTQAQFNLGVLALADNDLDTAEKAFNQVIEHDANDVQSITNLGVIALKREHHQLAIDYFTKALALDNAHLEARNNLAATFVHHDRFENALMHYDVLLKNDPDNTEYLYNSGVAQMALGHLNEAIDHFEHLLELQNDHFAALNNLAAIYIRMENKIKARSLLERAVTANPQDQTSQHMLRALSGATLTASTCPDYAANLFNNYALHYDQHLTGHLGYTLPNQLIRVLSELDINSIAHGLDLGCGTGLSGQVLRDSCQRLDGVDISSKMLDKARDKGIYDNLFESEALTFLEQTSRHYGLIVAADVLPYFGELDALFKAIKTRLISGGYFIFTTEISNISPWQLQETARFAHHADYLSDLAATHHLDTCYHEIVIARRQEGIPLSVFLIALKRK